MGFYFAEPTFLDLLFFFLLIVLPADAVNRFVYFSRFVSSVEIANSVSLVFLFISYLLRDYLLLSRISYVLIQYKIMTEYDSSSLYELW